jgi:hypothetical protein
MTNAITAIISAYFDVRAEESDGSDTTRLEFPSDVMVTVMNPDAVDERVLGSEDSVIKGCCNGDASGPNAVANNSAVGTEGAVAAMLESGEILVGRIPPAPFNVAAAPPAPATDTGGTWEAMFGAN